MATSKERQIARDKKLDEAVAKIDRILEILEPNKSLGENKKSEKKGKK